MGSFIIGLILVGIVALLQRDHVKNLSDRFFLPDSTQRLGYKARADGGNSFRKHYTN